MSKASWKNKQDSPPLMCHNLQEANEAKIATAKRVGNQKLGIKDQDAATKQEQLTKKSSFN